MLSIRTRFKRPGGAALLLAVGAAGGGAALAVAAVPDGSGVVHACVSVTTQGGVTVPAAGANLRIIDSANQTCNPVGAPATATELDWNQSGPAGATGATGPRGPQGVGVPPLIKSSNSPIGRAVLGTGKRALAFDILALVFTSIPPGPSETGRGTGRTEHQDLSITKQIDKTSPRLLKAELTRQHFNSVNIVVRSAGRSYAQYAGTGVIEVSYTQQKPDGRTLPTETVTFRFTSFKVQYKGPNPTKKK